MKVWHYTIPFRFQRITGNTLRFAGLFNLPIPPRSAFRIGVSTITRRQGGGEEAYYTYVEESDDDANKVSQRPGAHPVGKRIANKFFTSPVITGCKVVTYKRLGIIYFWKEYTQQPHGVDLFPRIRETDSAGLWRH
jgi:hypothetical protein